MPKPDTLPTPHDRLAKRVFARPEAAAILLRRVLPPRLLAWLDLSRIHVESTTFIDPRLGAKYSDLLYSIELRGSPQRLTVFAPIEHQSSPDPRLPLRMFWYASAIWERHLATRGRHEYRIPLILPIALLQYPTGWNVPNRLSDLFDVPPELRRILPSPVEFTFWVDPLGESVLDDPVASPEILALVELTRALLFAYHQPKSLTAERIGILAPLFDIVLRENPADARALWTYIVSMFDDNSPLHGILPTTVGRDNQKMFVSMKDSWLAEGRVAGRAEGRVAGRAEGRVAGRAEGRVAGLTEGLATALLQVLEHRELAIPAELRNRVLTTHHEPTLQRWFQRALAAEPLEQIFERSS